MTKEVKYSLDFKLDALNLLQEGKSAQHLFQERSVKYEFIHNHRDAFPIEKMCQIPKVSRSSYHHWTNKKPSKRLLRGLELGVAIKKIYDWSKGRYGSPRITKELQMQGIKFPVLLFPLP